MSIHLLIRYCTCLCACLLPFFSFCQNIITSVDHDARHVYDRMIIKTNGGPAMMHSSLYPYWRSDLLKLADLMGSDVMSPEDAYEVQKIRDQNNEFLQREGVRLNRIVYADSSKTFYYIADSVSGISFRESKKPLFNTFYRTPAFFYEVNQPDFYLRVNPLLHFSVGKETNEDVTTFQNQRGLDIRGGIGRSVYFQTSLYDSQIRFPNYVNRFTDSLGVVPGAGFYKNYESAFFKFEEGRDFLLASAYVGIDIGKYFGLQLGHHQHFIGDGIRSLFLSDFSTPFFSLKINTRIWKLHYQNIFAELAADNFQTALTTTVPVPKKYMAAHYLSFKPTNNLSFGLFETVVFNREGHQFELQYLNPVILYRTVEGAIGSPDNVMLGLNARWDLKKRISLYGQFLIDDILIGEILKGNMDWWGNKLGYQAGIKYIDAVVKNLDIQMEWNHVRPYTYSHYDENANYSHYKQALSHPLGANFNEWIFALHYGISPRLKIQSSLFFMKRGEDVDSISYGGNILKPNVLRPGDYGHATLQGAETQIIFWSSGIQYEISTGLFADLSYQYRNQSGDHEAHSLTTNMIQLGFRLNMARRLDIF